MAELEGLKFVIDADTSGADNAVQKLSDMFNHMQGALSGLENSSKGLKALAGAINAIAKTGGQDFDTSKAAESIRNISSALGSVKPEDSDKLRALGSGMNALAKTGGADFDGSKAGNSIAQISDSLKALDPANVDKLSETVKKIRSVGSSAGDKIQALGTAIQNFVQTLGSIDASAVTQVENIANAFEKLKSVDTKAITAISSALAGLSKVGSAGFSTTNAAESLQNIADVVKQIDEDSISRVKTLGQAMGNFARAGTANIQGLAGDIYTFCEALEGINESAVERLEKIANIIEKFKGVGSKVFSNVTKAMSGAEAAESPASPSAPITGGEETPAADPEPQISAFQRIGAAAATLAGQLKPGASALAAFAAKAANVSPYKLLGNAVTGAAGKVANLVSQIGRIAMYRAIRSAIKAVTDAVQKGTQNLYNWSKASNDAFGQSFSSNMDSIATDIAYLQNSIGALAGPVISAVAPVINTVTDALVSLINALNQVLSALSGASTYYKASKKSTDAYTSSAKKAAKANEATVLSFDELHKMNSSDSSSGSGGSSGSAGGSFDLAGIDSGISDWTQKLKDAFNAGDWTGLGTLLGNKFNDIVNMVDWKGIGNKIGYWFNAAIQTAYAMLKAIDFTNFGSQVATMLNAAIQQLVDNGTGNTLGRTLIRIITAGLDFLIGAITTIDWGNVGTVVGQFFIGSFDEAAEWIHSINWFELAYTLTQDLFDAIQGLDFGNIAHSFFNLLGTALGAAVNILGGIVSNIIVQINTYFSNYIEQSKKVLGDNGFAIIDGIFNGIVNAVGSVIGFLWNDVIQPLVQGFTDNLKIDANGSSIFHDIGGAIINGIVNGLYALEDTAVNAMLAVGTAIVNGIKGILGIAGSVDSSVFVDIAANVIFGFSNGVTSAASTAVNAIIEFGKTIISKFKELLGIASPSTVFKEIGGFVIEGLINGIKEMATSAVDTIKNFGDNLVNGLKQKLGIASPSTVFAEIGRFIVEGLNEGIEETEESTKISLTNFADSLKENFLQHLKDSGGDFSAAFQGWFADLNTFASGILSTVVPAINSFTTAVQNGTLAETLNAGVTQTLQTIQTAFGTTTAALTKFLNALALSIQNGTLAETLKATADSVLAAAQGILSGATGVASAAMGVFNAVLNANPIVLVITLIGLLVTALVKFASKNTTITNKFKSAWEGVKNFFKNIMKAILKVFEVVIESIFWRWNLLANSWLGKKLGLKAIDLDFTSWLDKDNDDGDGDGDGDDGDDGDKQNQNASGAGNTSDNYSYSGSSISYDTIYRAVYDGVVDSKYGADNSSDENTNSYMKTAVELLQEIADKDFTCEISTKSILAAMNRANARNGTTTFA